MKLVENLVGFEKNNKYPAIWFNLIVIILCIIPLILSKFETISGLCYILILWVIIREFRIIWINDNLNNLKMN
jgi:hypothetical protein